MSYDKPRQLIKKQRHYFADKGPPSQSYGFSRGHIWIWASWAPKNWCFWTVVLEKTLESFLDCKEIQPVHSKGNQSWIFIGRTDVEAPILQPPDANSWLRKDPDVGKDWRQEKGTTEDEIAGWHQQLDGVWASSGNWWKTREAWRAAVHGMARVGHDWATEQQQQNKWEADFFLWLSNLVWRTFLKNYLIYFNWRPIILQYCSGFCHMLSTWISHGYTCPPSWTPLPPLSPSHPSRLSQCIGFECPVSRIELGLVIDFTYGNLCFNTILSNHPTLAFSHRVQKSVLYICVSFAVLHIRSSLPSF